METKRFLIFVLILIQQFANSQITTKPPGESLQDVLDTLTAQVAQLMANQQFCTDCTNRLTVLENEARDNSARIGNLESQIQVLLSTISALENDNQAILGRLGTLEGAVDTNRGLINTLDSNIKNVIMPNINALKAAVERLDNVNKIWKNNFKIVNATFTALRQKITFRVPAIMIR